MTHLYSKNSNTLSLISKVKSKVYLFLLILILAPSLFSKGWGQTTTEFTSSGTWTCPSGVTSVQVECWGGGGAGGRSHSTNGGAGGGGAGGAYARLNSFTVVPGQTYTVTVGGIKVSSTVSNTAADNNGNPSWFNSQTTVFAPGGPGGAGVSSAANGAGGTWGGTCTGCIGDLVRFGGNGVTGNGTSNTAGGAGGGAAGFASNGGNGIGGTGGTGNSGITDFPGTGAAGPGNNNAGNAGIIYGGGGSGGKRTSNPGTNRNGGNGAQGYVLLTYTCPSFGTVSAGSNQTLAACATTTSLSGNTPLVGTGTWSCVSGCSGVTFNNPNSPTTTVSGLPLSATNGGTSNTVLRWTISNGECGTSQSDVTITTTRGSDCGIYTIPTTGNTQITTCGGTLYDSGGAAGNYVNNNNGSITINPSTSGAFVEVSGTITVEGGYDFLTIFDGTTTSGNVLWGGAVHGSGTSCQTFTVPLIRSTLGALTIRLNSDGSGVCAGVDLNIGCFVTAACSGTPNAGDIVASSPSSCANINLSSTLSLETLLLESGYTYQWQESTNNTTWTDIPGATGVSYVVTLNSETKYFRLKVTCSNGNAFAFTNSQIVFYDCSVYCASKATNTTYSSISRVQFNTIDNASSGCANYTNFTSISTNVLRGSSYSLTITKTNNCTGTTQYTGRFAAWIDWNADGDFDDAGEQVLSDASASNGPITVNNIVVPANAVLGTTRMRCIFREGTAVPPPCGDYSSWGETEDYTIIICANPTITSPTENSNIAICAGSNTSLSVEATTPEGSGNLSYQWQVNSGAGFTNLTNSGIYSNVNAAILNITGAPTSINGFVYRCVVSNGCGGSTTSDAATLTVNNTPQTASLIAPTDNSTGLNASSVTLSWSGNSANTGYLLYFGTDSNPTDILDGFDAGNVTSYITGALQPFTEYYWRVVAYNADCGQATSSSIFKFTTGAPGPLVSSFSPTSVCTSSGASVSINGANFTGATSVTINGVAISNFTVVSDILITAVLPSGVTTGKIEVTTPTGTGLSFTNFIVYGTIPASCATLQLPANEATDQNSGGVTLTWSSVANTASYDIYFGTNPTPGLLLTQNATSTSYFTGILSANTTYYWRVVPKNDCGVATGCSTTFSFTTGAPCLTQTSQSDFNAGTRSGVDIIQNPGNVILAGNGTQSLNLNTGTLSSGAITLTNMTFYGQIFRPTQAGYISQVDLYSRCSSCSGANPNIIVEIRDVVGGQPGNTVLASTTIPGFGSALEWRTVTFNAPLAVLNTTTDYALVVRSSAARTAGNYDLVRDNNSNAYGGNTYNYFTTSNSGSTWANSGYDFGFRTYMTPVTYVSNGTIESSLIDAGSSVHWTDLSWVAETQSGTEVKFQVAFSTSSTGPFDFIGPDATSATYFTTSVADLSVLDLLSQGKRYFKYKAFLATTTSTNTPVLNEVTACYCNPPIVSLINPVTTVCANQTVTYETQAGNTNYLWSVSGGIITSGGSNTDNAVTVTWGNSSQGSVSVIYSNECGPALSSASSNVTINALPTATIDSNNGPICESQNAVFNLSGTSGAVVTYSFNGGANQTVTLTSGVATVTIPSLTAGNYQFLLISVRNPISGCTNTINETSSIIVNPILNASVAVEASTTTICDGESITFTATPTNGGSSPQYQWFINGTPVSGETNPTFTTNSLNNNDVVTVQLTSNATPCLAGSPATSTGVTITVNPILTASVEIEATQEAICPGESITFTATPTNGGTTPSYQWFVNGSPVSGATSFEFTTSTLANGDIVTVEMDSNASPCLTGSPATSNEIEITYNPILTASVNITASEEAICLGGSITFTAIPTNGGTTPSYQWFVNESPVSGETNNTFTSSNLSDGDKVTAQLTSSLTTCIEGSPATSNEIAIALEDKTITITTQPINVEICVGGDAQFSVVATNGESYQWQTKSDEGSWSGLGSENFTQGGFYNAATAVHSGVYYAAFLDEQESNKVSVMKFDGSWSYVGGPGFTSFEADKIDIKVNSAGELFIAMNNTENNFDMVVMKFDGSQWSELSSPSISNVLMLSLDIDQSNNPVIAYALNDSQNSEVSVIKYNGSIWQSVGQSSFNDGFVNQLKLAIGNNDIPYVAFSDGSIGGKLSVMSFNGSWSYVGSRGLTGSSVYYISLALSSDGNPVVAFQDLANASKASVLKYNGSSWSYLGGQGISPEAIQYTSIATDASGGIYLSFIDDYELNQLFVMSYNGDNWIDENSTAFENKYMSNSIMVADDLGVLYVLYEDWDNSFGASAMIYDSWTDIQGATAPTLLVNGVTIDDNGNMYRCIVSNDCNISVISNAATLIVLPSTIEISTINDVYTCVESLAVFEILPIAQASYQWMVNDGTGFVVVSDNSTYSGATTNSLSVVTSGSLNNYTFKCVVTTSCGIAESNDAKLFVTTEAPAAPTEILGSRAVCPATTNTFSIDPVLGATSYVWTVNNGASIISGQGTTSIQVLFGSINSTVSVYAVSDCGNSLVTSASILVACTYVRDKECGITVGSMSTAVYAIQVSGATHYEFLLTSQTDGTQISIVRDNGVNLFRFNMSTLSKFNTTYDVVVRAFVNDTWTSWGKSCEVSTPNYPLTKVRSQDCGKVLSKMTEGFYCEKIDLATDFQWEFTAENSGQIIIRNKGKNTNLMHANEAKLAQGTQYSVRVRPFIDGEWRDFGDACLLTTPGTASREFNAEDNTESIEIFPNPIIKGCSINIYASNINTKEDVVELLLVDVIGNVLVSKTLRLDYNKHISSSIELLDSYTPGIYFILLKSNDYSVSKKLIVIE